MAVEQKETHCEPQLPFRIRNSKVLNGNLSKISQSGTKLFISLNATTQKTGNSSEQTSALSATPTIVSTSRRNVVVSCLREVQGRGIYAVTHVTCCTIFSFQLSLLS